MILADDQVATLAEMFLIAAVIVAPFGYLHVRRVLRSRPRTEPAVPAEAAAGPDPDDLGSVVARVSADVAGHAPGDVFTVEVPAAATIGGRPADPHVVTSILADALRRDGIEILARGAATWECRRGRTVGPDRRA